MRIRMKGRAQVSKKIIPKKHIKHMEDQPETYLKEIAQTFSCRQSSILKRL